MYDRTKSTIKIVSKLVTTEDVVDAPTLFVPKVVCSPQAQLISDNRKPKTKAFTDDRHNPIKEIEEEAKKIVGEIEHKLDAVIIPLAILVANEKIFKTGIINTQAQIRGIIR